MIKKDVEEVEVANRLPAASEMLAGWRRVLGFLESQNLQAKKVAMRSAVDGVDAGEGETKCEVVVAAVVMVAAEAVIM